MKLPTVLLAALALPLISAQLSGSVGPTTTRASKRTKICNVLDYGGTASKTSDVGPPLSSAFAACKSGGTGKTGKDENEE
jgi:rhamnogalacturonan hydrolase